MTVAPHRSAAEWSLPDVALVIGAGLIASSIATALVVLSIGSELTILAFSLLFAAQTLGSLAAMWVLSERKGTGDLVADYGLAVHAADVWAIFLGMGLQIGVSILMAPLLFRLFPDGPPEQAVAALAGQARGALEIVLVFVSIVVVAPIVEEMIYRKMLLDRLRRSFGTAPAVLGSAAIFALIHLMDPNAIAVVPGLFIVGIVLGVLAVRRGDLSLAILTHAGVNLTGVILLLWGDRMLDYLQRLAEQAEQAAVVVGRLTGG